MSDAALGAGMVVLGKITGPYGVHGAVRVHPFADDPLSWASLPSWWLGQEGDAPENWQQTKLIRCKAHNDSLIAQLECIPDRNASEKMQGMLVGVPRENLPPAGKNEYYWADLIGLSVVNVRDVPLGRVLGLIETPANDVLRVGDGEKPEQLLPFVASVVLDVDMAAGKVRVDWEADW